MKEIPEFVWILLGMILAVLVARFIKWYSWYDKVSFRGKDNYTVDKMTYDLVLMRAGTIRKVYISDGRSRKIGSIYSGFIERVNLENTFKIRIVIYDHLRVRHKLVLDPDSLISRMESLEDRGVGAFHYLLRYHNLV